MSTLKTNTAGYRIAQLGKTGDTIFHINDLANLWNIKEKNTLRTTLRRYHKNGLIHRIYRGVYSTINPDRLDAYLLGAKTLHAYCYLSAETILFRDGYISQKPAYLTYIGEKSQKISVMELDIKCRQLAPQFLYNPAGIIRQNGYNVATTIRAIADVLYFNKYYYFDRKIDLEAVKQMQKEIGYPVT